RGSLVFVDEAAEDGPALDPFLERSATGSRAGAGARWTPRSRLASPAHAAVVELAAAWRDPAAWEGMTEAGGLRMPADVMGGVAGRRRGAGGAPERTAIRGVYQGGRK